MCWWEHKIQIKSRVGQTLNDNRYILDVKLQIRTQENNFLTFRPLMCLLWALFDSLLEADGD